MDWSSFVFPDIVRIEPMRKLASIAVLLFAAAPAATAAIIGFEYLPFGEFTSYTRYGVTFTPLGGGSMIAQPAPNGTIGLMTWPFPFAEFRADFDVYASFVSVDMGDYGVDPDRIFLQAFDEHDLSLEYTDLVIPAISEQMFTLQIEQPNIAYVIFGARNALYGSSIIADNFEFELVPEPATIILLALSGITILRKRPTTR